MKMKVRMDLDSLRRCHLTLAPPKPKPLTHNQMNTNEVLVSNQGSGMVATSHQGDKEKAVLLACRVA
jgi:hypothetical protein